MTIPLRTFIRKTVPNYGSTYNAPIMFGAQTKHNKMTYDGLNRRSLCGGGDTGGSSAGGHGMVWSYVSRTNTWTIRNRMCPGPGKIYPNEFHIDDTCGLTVDYKRNRYISFGVTGTGGATGPGGTCQVHDPGDPTSPTGGTAAFGVLAQDMTTANWSILVDGTASYPSQPPGKVTYGSANLIQLDPVNDVLITADDDNFKFFSPTTFDVSSQQAVPYRSLGTGGVNLGNTVVLLATGQRWIQNEMKLIPSRGIDVIGRRLYMMVTITAENFKRGVRFAYIDLDTKVMTYLATPPVPAGSTTGSGGTQTWGGPDDYLGFNNPEGMSSWGVFDTKNRAYIWIPTRSGGGYFQDVYVYPTATGIWERYPVVQNDLSQGPVEGSCWWYDDDENLLIGFGSFEPGDNCEPFAQNNLWFWRYA